MVLESADIDAIVQAILVIAAALAALYEYWQKRTAEATAEANAEEATNTAATLAAVQSFFDPEGEVTEAPSGTPARSWQMSDAVKEFVICDYDATGQASILQQIEAAEEAGKIDYYITLPDGWMKISYGQIVGSAKGEATPEATT